jgi:hypothetical protein
MLRTKPKAIFLINPRLGRLRRQSAERPMVDRALGRGTAPHSSTPIRSSLAEMDASVSVVRGFSRIIGGLS